MVKKIAPFAFVLIANLWIWKIFSINIPEALIVIAVSILLWLSIISNRGRYFLIAALAFALLLFLDYKTSSKNSLTFLNDNEQMHLLERLKAYPPVYFKLGSKIIWIPAANWLEQRKETLVFYKLEENFSELIDPNLYFFANHPRERVGAQEFEKFPYILLPFLIFGLLSINKKNLKVFLLAASPLVLNSIIGNSNPAGPFALFPLIVVSVSLGIAPFISKKVFYIPFTVLFILVFIQTLSYAQY